MRSRLQIFCTMLMEAAWLAAAAIIPLFFNPSSTQVFEPDKIFLLRSLALIAGAAWLLREIAQNEWDAGRRMRSFLQKPMVAPVLVLAAIYLLSSSVSVAPVISWFGSYYEAQGMIAFLCYLILFLIVLSELRTSAQLKRLQFVLILASLPISCYAILQHFGADPFAWYSTFGGRAGGSMGNPIYLGGYLVMVIPLTLCRIVDGWKNMHDGADRRPGLVLLVCSGTVLALQLLALYVGQSRGPILGLAGAGYLSLFVWLVLNKGPRLKSPVYPVAAAGLGILVPAVVIASARAASRFFPGYVLLFLAAAAAAAAAVYWFVWRSQWGRSWLWLTWGTQTLALLLIFAVNPSHTVGGIFGQASSASRLFQSSDESIRYRQALWETAARFLRSGPQPTLPDGTHDPYYFLRPAIGYGPDCSWFISNAYAVPSLVRIRYQESENRMHNETFDDLITTGYLGTLASLWILAAAFYYSLRCLGFSFGGRGKIVFGLMAGTGVLAGVLLPMAAGATPLIGIGVVAGLLAGIFAFVASGGFRDAPIRSDTNGRQLFVLGILGAITAHLIETGVAFSITPSRFYFYLYLALLAIAYTRDWTVAEEPAKRHNARSSAPQTSPLLPFAALSALVVFVESWCFTFSDKSETSAPALFVQSLFSSGGSDRSGLQFPVPLFLLVLTICGALGLIYSEQIDTQISRAGLRKSIRGSLVILPAVWIAAGMLAALFWTVLENATPLENSLDSEARVTLFVLGMLVFLAIISRILYRQNISQAGVPAVRMREVLAALVLAACAGVGIWKLTLCPVWADMAKRVAKEYETIGNLKAAAQVYERATQLASNVAPYYFTLGLEQGAAANWDPAQLDPARASFKKAMDLNPFDPVVYRTFGTFLMNVGEHSSDAQVRAAEITEAIAYYQRASRLAPNYPNAFNETGRCFYLLGEYEKAKSVFQKSLAMNPDYWRTYKYLGEMQYLEKNYSEALQSFSTAARLNTEDFDARKNMGALYALLGKTNDAIRVSLEALKAAPNDPVLLTRLATWYFAMGDYNSGVDFAKRAYDATPGASRGSFDAFKEQLLTHRK